MPLFPRRERIHITNPNGPHEDHRSAASSFRSSVKSLAASAIKVNQREGEKLRRLIQPWQFRALSYYDLIPEIKYAGQFYARGLSPLDLFSAKQSVDKNGRVLVEPTDETVAVEALSRIQDPGGGRTNLQAAYGRLRFLTGESYMLVSKNPASGVEQWEMLSADELRIQGNTYLRYRAPSLNVEEYREAPDDAYEPLDDREAVVYRLWQRHPRYSALADSTMQGVLDLCEELLLLTQAVRSRARSRLAGSGILYIPEEISPAPPKAAPDEDPAEDVFFNELVQAMLQPITDEGAASAVVPLLIRGPGDWAEKIRHIQIIDPMQLYPETGLRRECIERIAIGLDMPPETLLGLADSNHWSAWQVDEQTWKAHLQPVADSFVADLTSAYYQPTLKAAGVQDWQEHVIAYDASAVINHPNRTKDAKDAFDRGAIGWPALRDALGFEESDQMTPEEVLLYIARTSRDPGFALTGIPSRPTPEGITAEEQGGGLGGAENVEPGPPGEENSSGEQTQTEPESALVGSTNGHISPEAYQVIGACDLATLRVREVAGNTLRNLAKRDPELRAKLEGVPARDVVALAGKEALLALGVNEETLIGAAKPFIREALNLWKLDPAVVDKVVDLVERHAARTLYELRLQPMPPSARNYIGGLIPK